MKIRLQEIYNFIFNCIKSKKHTKCEGHNSCIGLDTFRRSYTLTHWDRPAMQNSLLLRGLQWTLYNCTWKEPSLTTSNLYNKIVFIHCEKICFTKGYLKDVLRWFLFSNIYRQNFCIFTNRNNNMWRIRVKCKFMSWRIVRS